MTRTSSNRIDSAKQPPMGNRDFDAGLIDDEFDDSFDRYLADIRESLSDFRSF
jgi:hypothetical protein